MTFNSMRAGVNSLSRMSFTFASPDTTIPRLKSALADSAGAPGPECPVPRGLTSQTDSCLFVTCVDRGGVTRAGSADTEARGHTCIRALASLRGLPSSSAVIASPSQTVLLIVTSGTSLGN